MFVKDCALFLKKLCWIESEVDGSFGGIEIRFLSNNAIGFSGPLSFSGEDYPLKFMFLFRS